VQLAAPHQVAVDAAGNVYVADTGNNRVVMVTPQGVTSTVQLQLQALSPASLAGPQGVAMDRVGNLYIADTGNARVLMQPANGEYATRVVPTDGVTLTTPIALATDTAGNLYVLDSGLVSVVELPQAAQGLNYVEATPAGPTAVTYKSGAVSSPRGIAVDPAGSVYVSDSVANAVFVFTAGQTTSATALIPTGLSAPASSVSAPAGLALDTASNLYVADAGNNRVFEEYRGPQTLAMGQVGIGTTSPLYPVEVGSYGTVATTLTGFAISSPFTSLTTGSAQCMSTTQLGIGGYCSAEFDYTPGSTPGAVTGSLQATDNAAGSPQAITITATAVVQQSQTVSFTLASPVTYGVAPITLGGTATSGLTVTYTITSGAQYGSVKGNVLTVTGAGTIVVQASQAGSPAYKAATAVSQTLVVNKASLTLTANNITGGTGVIPPLTYSYSGLVNGDTFASATTGAPAETTTATATSPSGTYPITLAQGTLAAANYTFAFVSGTLTLQGTGQTINFTSLPASVTYGVAPITLVATATSGLPVSFTVTGPATLIGTTLTITGVGTVTVTATQAGSTPIYQPYAPAQPVVQTIVVNQATLTVTANSATRIYGANNPTFTGTYTGAQNGDTFLETYSTAATSSSNVGTYTITPVVTGTALANYKVVTVTGTLTITQAATSVVLTVSANPITVSGAVTLTATLTIPGGTPTGTFTFYQNGTSIGGATYTTTGTTVTAVKTYTALSASEAFYVVYANDANLASATSATVTVPVISATGTSLASTNMTPGTNQQFTLQATVRDFADGAGERVGHLSEQHECAALCVSCAAGAVPVDCAHHQYEGLSGSALREQQHVGDCHGGSGGAAGGFDPVVLWAGEHGDDELLGAAGECFLSVLATEHAADADGIGPAGGRVDQHSTGHQGREPYAVRAGWSAWQGRDRLGGCAAGLAGAAWRGTPGAARFGWADAHADCGGRAGCCRVTGTGGLRAGERLCDCGDGFVSGGDYGDRRDEHADGDDQSDAAVTRAGGQGRWVEMR
jgi:hypothetical protein